MTILDIMQAGGLAVPTHQHASRQARTRNARSRKHGEPLVISHAAHIAYITCSCAISMLYSSQFCYIPFSFITPSAIYELEMFYIV